MSPVASIFSGFWHDQLVAHQKQALFLVLVGFLGAFIFIRMSTRLQRSPRVAWWPGSIVSNGGVHIHHLVFGICLMLGAGTLGFATFNLSPEREICAAVFGVGAGLTIDEFALWIHLDDVYWTEEGRSSIDATVIAAVAMLLVLFGVDPFHFTTDTLADTIASILTALGVFSLVAICFAKQRFMHGVIGFFVWPLAAYGGARLGKPTSPWAKRFYGMRRPQKRAQAEERFRSDRRTQRFKERFRDAVGGVPSVTGKARLADQQARAEAAAEMRKQADRVAASEAREAPAAPAPPSSVEKAGG